MANPKLTITTPQGVGLPTGGEFKWDGNFGGRMTGLFNAAQQFVDSEVLRYCAPLVPFDTGMLRDSGTLGTVIGSGMVVYSTPYAARLYYNPQYSFQGAPQRGGLWFERMKAQHKGTIEHGANKIAGGR